MLETVSFSQACFFPSLLHYRLYWVLAGGFTDKLKLIICYPTYDWSVALQSMGGYLFILDQMDVGERLHTDEQSLEQPLTCFYFLSPQFVNLHLFSVLSLLKRIIWQWFFLIYLHSASPFDLMATLNCLFSALHCKCRSNCCQLSIRTKTEIQLIYYSSLQWTLWTPSIERFPAVQFKINIVHPESSSKENIKNIVSFLLLCA